jgi:hypothetical protein
LNIRERFAKYDELTREQQAALLSAEENADLDFEPHSDAWWQAVATAYNDHMNDGVYAYRNAE